jgi:hypothetical protein
MAELLGFDVQLSRLVLPDIPDTLRTRWMWELDLRQEVSAKKMLNQSHLTGLVLCRVSGLKTTTIPGAATDLIGSAAVIRTTYRDMSMRSLHDSVEHAQMHMQPLIVGGYGSSVEISESTMTENLNRFGEHLERLFARLGQILLPLKETPDAVFDDPNSLEVAVDGNVTRIMTSSALRWFLNVFVILFRHVEFRRVAQAPPVASARLELKEFHIEAATDDFYTYSQFYDLPPAAVLQYCTDFGLMFNSVTQITYFNFPDYQRRKQLSYEQVSSGEPAIYSIAPVLSMLPNVKIMYEDGLFGAAPGATHAAVHAREGWRLIIGAGSIFLLAPSGKLFQHDNVLELMRAVPIS